MALDVWSDARGPFVLVSTGLEGYAIWHRTSTSWSRLISDPTTSGELRFLTGVPGGPLWLYGGIPCGVRYIDAGQASCGAGVASITDVFVVSADLAYGIRGDRVLVFDGDGWVQMGTPLPPTAEGREFNGRAVWGDANGVVAVDFDGRVAESTQDGSVQPMILPDGVVANTVWRSGGITWVGARDGQVLASDGSGWRTQATLTDGCDEGIRGVWGAGNVLFVHTDHRLARWDGQELEVLLTWPCGSTIGGIWGTSPDEVFVVAPALGAPAPGCGSVAVFKVEGTNVWQM